MKITFVLIFVVLAAGCTANIDVNNTTATGQAPKEISIEERCAGASIKITSLSISGSNAVATVTNNGNVDNIVITSAFVFNKAGGTFPMKSIFVADLDKGEVASLEFSSLNVPACPQDFDKLFVTADCPGVSDTYTTPACA